MGPMEIGMPGYYGAPREQLLVEVIRTIESAMPIHEVLHSLHTQALAVPEIQNLPAMQRFSQAGLQLLHSLVAAAGYARRMLAGDTGADVMSGMLHQLREVQRYHAETRAALTQLTGSEAARASEPLRSMAQVMGLAEQAHWSLGSLVQPLLAAAGTAGGPAQAGRGDGY